VKYRKCAANPATNGNAFPGTHRAAAGIEGDGKGFFRTLKFPRTLSGRVNIMLELVASVRFSPELNPARFVFTDFSALPLLPGSSAPAEISGAAISYTRLNFRAICSAHYVR